MAKLGLIFSRFKDFDLEAFLDYAAETGYGYVELWARNAWKENDSSDEPLKNAERIRAAVEKRGLKISALDAENDFVVLAEQAVRHQVERMKRIIKLAGVMGAPCIRTEGGKAKPEVPAEKYGEAIAACLEQLLDDVEKTGVALAVDNHGVVTNQEGVLKSVFERVRNPLVGTNLDIYNYHWYGYDVQTTHRICRNLLPHILHVHLKDGLGIREAYRGKALGEGEIEAATLVRMLSAGGYKGVWCAEYEGSEDDPVGYTKCYRWMSRHVGAGNV